MNLFLFVILFAGCSLKSLKDTSDKLSNTIWVSKVSPNCVDTLHFSKNGKLLSYSCEIEYQSKGNYTIKADTVTLLVNESSHDMPEKWRHTFVLNNEKLIPIRSEQLSKGKWHLEKSSFEQSYFFKRIR